MAELRKLAQHCEFGDSLNEMLHNRLVCRINDHQIQCPQLSETKLSYSLALQSAQAVEIADHNTKEFEKSVEVHVIQRDDNQSLKLAARPSHLRVYVVEDNIPQQPVNSNTVYATTVGKRGT